MFIECFEKAKDQNKIMNFIYTKIYKKKLTKHQKVRKIARALKGIV